MRLINVHTFELREFDRTNVPYYAILSHRWEDEEVTFQDLLSGRGRDMMGWKKIEGCCRMASQDRLEWVWVDSCCIDKSSSAELSEAINSMFRWYRDAEICYAYLSDVLWERNGEHLKGNGSFRASQWFTRGWTLQELLAPDEVKFFDMTWQELGTKETLHKLVSNVTGIKHLFNFEQASMAQKMSWASQRVTTRIEDQAYCLLGIFGINMPPLYGEGEGAFLRLQLEILKISNDESLFAWRNEGIMTGGLLAPSPRSFRNAGDIISVDFPRLERLPYMMTNKGIEIWVRLEDFYPDNREGAGDSRCQYWWTALNCARSENLSIPLSIALMREPGSAVYSRSIDFQRLNPDSSSYGGPLPLSRRSSGAPKVELGNGQWKKIWVQHSHSLYCSMRTYTSFRIQTHHLPTPGWEVLGRVLLDPERGRWGEDTSKGINLKLCSSYAGILLRRTKVDAKNSQIIMLKFGVRGDARGNRVVFVTFLDVHKGGSLDMHLNLDGDISLDTNILDGLRYPQKPSDFMHTHVLFDSAKSIGSGKFLRASLQKVGGSNSREIITIRLAEVQEEDLNLTDRIC